MGKPRPLDYASIEPPPSPSRSVIWIAITWWTLLLSWLVLVLGSSGDTWTENAEGVAIALFVLALGIGAAALLALSVLRHSASATKAVAMLLSLGTFAVLFGGLAITTDAILHSERTLVVVILAVSFIGIAAYVGGSAWLFWRWLRVLELHALR